MEKGKYGIRLAFYGVAAFAMVLFGNFTVLALITAAALFIEKDEWASRQAIQACFLCLVPAMISTVFSVFGFIDWFGWAANSWESGSVAHIVTTTWSRIKTVVYFATDIAVLVFGFIGMLKNAKGKEANIPVADKFAQWVYGKVVVKQQPVYVQQTAAPTVCANCGAPLNGAAFCTKCGTPVAK